MSLGYQTLSLEQNPTKRTAPMSPERSKYLNMVKKTQNIAKKYQNIIPFPISRDISCWVGSGVTWYDPGGPRVAIWTANVTRAWWRHLRCAIAFTSAWRLVRPITAPFSIVLNLSRANLSPPVGVVAVEGQELGSRRRQPPLVVAQLQTVREEACQLRWG